MNDIEKRHLTALQNAAESVVHQWEYLGRQEDEFGPMSPAVSEGRDRLDIEIIGLRNALLRSKLARGVQIAYIPDHAEGNLKHRDVEYGFVTSVRDEDVAFCRYWSNANPNELRTKANSEATPIRNLVLFTFHIQSKIDFAIKEFCWNGG